MRVLFVLVGLAGLVAGWPAVAAEVVPPVCGAPEVLQLVSERLGRAGTPTVIEVGSVGQAPGARPDLVNCAVRVHVAVYDTNRGGMQPVEVVRVYQYGLELRRNGAFLLP